MYSLGRINSFACCCDRRSQQNSVGHNFFPISHGPWVMVSPVFSVWNWWIGSRRLASIISPHGHFSSRFRLPMCREKRTQTKQILKKQSKCSYGEWPPLAWIFCRFWESTIPFPPFEVFGMCPWSLCYRRSHSVINGCPVFGYVRADVTVISHHCAKLKPRLHLQVVIMVVTNFGQDCGHLEIVSRYRCKTGLNSALVFWHVIHGQMLQELSEKNMVNSWDFQHLRLLLTLPTFNMDIWKSSLWKRTSCSTSSSSLGFHVKLLNLASFFKHKLDHKWV